MNKHLGFTLAEVLIALTIIGIIAVMTVPSLVSNIDNQTNVTKAKKAYGVINQVAGIATAEDGSTTLDAPSITKGGTTMNAGLISSIAKNVSGTPLSTSSWKSADGLIYTVTNSSDTSSCTSSGESTKTSCGTVYVTVKGTTAATADSDLIKIDSTDHNFKTGGKTFALPMYKDGVYYVQSSDAAGNYEAGARAINGTLGQTYAIPGITSGS